MMKYDVLNIEGKTEADFEKAFEAMSKNRQARCKRYKFLQDRRRMAFGEELLRKLMTSTLKAENQNIVIENLPSGKPVAKLSGKEVNVSITHSGDFVACAFSDTPVGIDLEEIREISPRLLNRFFSEEEKGFIRKENTSEKLSKQETQRFFELWTAKEAYVKLTGEGLKGMDDAEVLPLVKHKKHGELVSESIITEQYVCTIIYKKN